MQRRRRLPGSLKPGATTESPATSGASISPSVPTTAPLLAHIQTVIESGGQIIIGAIEPMRNAAVAHDGTKTLAMLRRRRDESIPALLVRLNAAIATAKSTGTRVDEINPPPL